MARRRRSRTFSAKLSRRKISSTSCSDRFPARSSAAVRSTSRSRPPGSPPGLPTELLTRRPDIRQAEQQLVSANAQIGVAQAQLYPTVTISGFAGAGGATINGANFGPFWIFNALPGITLPIFNMGRLQANVEFNEARAQEAGLRYRQTLQPGAPRSIGCAGRHPEASGISTAAGSARQIACGCQRGRQYAVFGRRIRATWRSWIRSVSTSMRKSNWSQAKRDESLERDPALQGPRRGMADRVRRHRRGKSMNSAAIAQQSDRPRSSRPLTGKNR